MKPTFFVYTNTFKWRFIKHVGYNLKNKNL